MAMHVPERFRKKGEAVHPVYRDCIGNNGVFILPAVIPGREIVAIASDGAQWDLARELHRIEGEPWEHVSVHCRAGKKNYAPTWKEMCYVKGIFWDPEDVVIQFHPAESQYVNTHETTLHLWRPLNVEFPMPPKICV